MAVIAADHSIAAGGHIKRVVCGQVKEPLRFLESFDFACALALTEINHLDGPVSKGGDEDALSFEIVGKMIDAALDAGKRDFALELESRRLCKRNGAAKCGGDYEQRIAERHFDLSGGSLVAQKRQRLQLGNLERFAAANVGAGQFVVASYHV